MVSCGGPVVPARGGDDVDRRVVVAGESARVVVAREAMGRGEAGSGVLALTPVQWVRRHAPSLRAGGAGQVVAVAEAFAVAGNAPVKAAVLSGVLPVRSAAVVVAEADRLRPLLAEGAEPAVLEGLVSMAVQHGARGCRMVRPGLLARYGLDGQLQGEQDVAKRFVALSQPRVDELGLAEYRLTVDVEGRAVLEAALGPLSAPRPTEGERDLRSSDQRRGEALVGFGPPRGRGGRVDADRGEVAAVRHRRLRDAAPRRDRRRADPRRRRGGGAARPGDRAASGV